MTVLMRRVLPVAFGILVLLNAVPSGRGQPVQSLYTFPNWDVYRDTVPTIFQGADGRLYGLSAQSGQPGAYATLFALNTDGSGYTLLCNFGVSAGTVGGFFQGADGRLYGVTQSGGEFNSGSIFALDMDGSGFAPIYSFAGGTNGSDPITLIQASDGRLYGIAASGGANTAGFIFAVNVDGTNFTPLYQFPNNGSAPRLLYESREGTLYCLFNNGAAIASKPVGAAFSTIGSPFGAVSPPGLEGPPTETATGAFYLSTASLLYGYSPGFVGLIPLASAVGYIETAPIQGRDGRLYYVEALALSVTGTANFPLYVASVDTSGEVTANCPLPFGAPCSNLIQGTDGNLYCAADGTVFRVGIPSVSITSQPQSVTAPAGSTPNLSVSVTNSANASYEWWYHGSAITRTLSTSLPLPAIGTEEAGEYTVAVTEGLGVAVSQPISVVVTSDARIVNFSGLSTVVPEQSAWLGFVIGGSGAKQLLLRGDGPSLQNIGGGETLTNPILTLFDSADDELGVNAGWGSLQASGPVSPASAQLFQAVGAFPLDPDSKDCAMEATLPAGAYSAALAAGGSTGGLALAELYDADPPTTNSRVVNASLKAEAGAGSEPLTAGFVVSGTTSETLMIRAVGPTLGLAPFDLSGVLAQPTLTIYDSTGAVIASNSGWANGAVRSGNSAVVASPQSITNSEMEQVGAFALNSYNDAGMVVTLPPGAYVASVVGANGGAGLALLEVYDLPAASP